MLPSRADLADFAYFLAIARHRSFRRAGLEMGVSASAISHALKALEARLGVRLFNRTNRSVMLTAAGEELLGAIGTPFEAIGQAVDNLNRFREAPAGHIRLNIVADAAPLLLGPVMPVFQERYPDIEVDIVASNRMVDIVGEGFDAGIRYGGTVPEDMIAQRLSADLRWVVAASPAYLDRFGTPQHPGELADHRCLGIRLGNDRIYRWEFAGPDGELAIVVPSRITANGTEGVIAMAVNGGGLVYGIEPAFAPYLATGALRLVLADWAIPGDGFQLYYSSRRQVPVALRLLVELIREMRPLGL
ncbi:MULTISPECIES: LysR family transcriptional regulator [unclassified Sphingomonas]|uniref:LysR family transcriptional regulator n=1 Tax=unclassified Sphingomonas TaxID=196159 RepID=UPI002269C066|nr:MULTISPECIES: LysR family transcriptional regulator [unclassified Sphingomonas]